MKLDELEVGYPSTGLPGERDPVARGTGRVRCRTEQRPGTAGCENRRVRPNLDEPFIGHDPPTETTAVADREGNASPFDSAGLSVLTQGLHNGCTGRIARVRRARHTLATLTSKVKATVISSVEPASEIGKFHDAFGSFLAQDGNRGSVGMPGSHSHRVDRMQLGGIIRGERSRDTALCPWRRALTTRTFVDHENVGSAWKMKRAEKPGCPCTDEQNVG